MGISDPKIVYFVGYIISSPKVAISSEADPASCSMVTEVSFPGSKAAEA